MENLWIFAAGFDGLFANSYSFDIEALPA